jgi:hypothetical protein
MPIKKIDASPGNTKIDKLNNLISQYEKKPGSKTLLQKIDALRNQIYLDSTARKVGNFMDWYISDPIRTEINFHKMGQDRSIIFTEDSQNPIKDLTLSVWQKLTKPLIPLPIPLIGGRYEQYNRMDKFIIEVEKANKIATEQGDPKSLLALKTALEELQKQTLFMINNEIPDNTNLLRNFEALLSTTNHKLNNLIKSNLQLLSSPTHAAAPLMRSLIAENEQSQIELVRHLFYTKNSKQLNGFNVVYLGGSNNRNWLATNEETGKQFVIRLEQADDPRTDYSLVDAMRSDETIKRHLAEDCFYHPMLLPSHAEGYDDHPVNVAISEFCPSGDLRSFQQYAVDISPEKIKNTTRCTGVLNLTEQIASFASDLNKQHMAYMDIKASNFLIRDSGKVITADTKSIVRTDNENRVAFKDITTTFKPPEQNFWLKIKGVPKEVEAEAYMTYQIGFAVYDLMVSTKDYNAGDAHLALQEGESLNFDLPVFATPEGKKIQALIESTMDPDPKKRPSLDKVVAMCQSLQKEFSIEARAEVEPDVKPEATVTAAGM